MTEAEWLKCDNPKPMLTFLYGGATSRKVRLFLVACCERVEDRLADGRCRSALACARRAADGRADESELGREHEGAKAAWGTAVLAAGGRRFGVEAFARMCRTHSTGIHLTDQVAATDPCALASQAVQATSAPQDTFADQAAWGALSAARALGLVTGGGEAHLREMGVRCTLLRDIFGHPFRPVTFPPSWRTDTAVVLAQQMYDTREFSAMPILADALQDAGCDSADILDHCRGQGPHVRGCWVVDLVLGKE